MLLILIIVMALLLSACSKKRMERKIAEKLIETAIGADVNLNKDSASIASEDGSMEIGEKLEWPKDKMGALPELKADIKMIYADNENNGISITFESLKPEEARKYIEKLKELGFKDGSEYESTGEFTFTGYNKEMEQVVFHYRSGEGGIGNLGYIVDSGYEAVLQEEDSSEEIDMADAAPWPKDFIADLPKLEGKITGITSNGENYKYIDMNYVKKEKVLEYIEEIKTLGFNIESYSSMAEDYLNYSSWNEDGDYISVEWYGGEEIYIGLQRAE